MKSEKLDMQEIKKAYLSIFEEFFSLLKNGVAQGNCETQKVVRRLYNVIDKYYGCNNQIFKVFMQMYITQPEYIKILSSYDKRLPNYVHESIKIYLEKGGEKYSE